MFFSGKTNTLHATPTTTPEPSFSLYNDYSALFRTEIADSQSLRDECFRIRHEVYCVERGFLDGEHSSKGLERDIFDERSAHSLLYDRASGLAIGTVRLIIADRGSRAPSTPFHDLCKDRLTDYPELLGLSRTAEVSRLALSKQRCENASFSNAPRRRSADSKNVHPSSYVALGLFQMVIEMAVRNRVDYLCCVMEPSLLRMLARCGLYFKNLGECIEYHGRRQPCYTHLIDMLDGAKADRPDAWEILTDLGRFHPERKTAKRFAYPAAEPLSTEPYPLRVAG
jgi:N-acyl amino acid synthase of PEP-CTERM/exosortase system